MIRRLQAPKFWKVERKRFAWAVSPSPGPHKKRECIPLQVIVRDLLGFANTGKEAKRIIKRGEFLVDGKSRKDPGYPVGLFDVVSAHRIGKHWRVVPAKQGLKLVKIDLAESDRKVLRVENVTLTKGKKYQFNLNDGKNLLLSEKKFSTGDSLLVKLPTLKLIDHFLMKEGNLVLIIKGKHVGNVAKIEKLIEGAFKRPPRLICTVNGKQIEVLKKYAVVVGKKNPVITVSE